MKNLIYRPNGFVASPSQFDQLFDNMVNFNFEHQHHTPMLNIKETTAGFNLELAAPGLAKDDFNVKIENNLLTISAKKETKAEVENEKYTRKEFGFQSFSRSFTLPKTIDAENVKAAYENGVLKIELVHLPETKKEAKAIVIN